MRRTGNKRRALECTCMWPLREAQPHAVDVARRCEHLLLAALRLRVLRVLRACGTARAPGHGLSDPEPGRGVYKQRDMIPPLPPNHNSGRKAPSSMSIYTLLDVVAFALFVCRMLAAPLPIGSMMWVLHAQRGLLSVGCSSPLSPSWPKFSTRVRFRVSSRHGTRG